MDYARLTRFVARHGSVAIIDSKGKVRILLSGEPDVHQLVERADRFLWDGVWRGRVEMEALIAQGERGLAPGCAECERLERELASARERDRTQEDLEGRYEKRALATFQEHRGMHR